MTLTVLLFLITLMFAHWVSDFIMQNDWMARNKSNSLTPLATHILVYTITFTIITTSVGCILRMDPYTLIAFGITNGIIHFAIDFFTSKLSSAAHNAGRIGGSIPNFGMFTVIGADQMLHFITMFILFYVMF